MAVTVSFFSGGSRGRAAALLMLWPLLSLTARANSVEQPLPGEVATAPVTWTIPEKVSPGGQSAPAAYYQPSLSYPVRLGGASSTTATFPTGMTVSGPVSVSGDTLKMGFSRPGHAAGNVLITLPAAQCSMTFSGLDGPEIYAVSASLASGDISALTSRMQGTGSWRTNGQAIITEGTSHALSEQLPLTLNGSGSAQVMVQSDALPGTYTIQMPLGCEQMTAPGTDNAVQGITTTATITVTVTPRPPSCSVTPSTPVDFGSHILTQDSSAVTVARASASLSAACDVPAGSEAINKGMYLTFNPGTRGLYGGNVHRLGTSLDGLYITGGSTEANADCGVANMAFNGSVSADYLLTTLQEGSNPKSRDLYFSLCHDPSRAMPFGSMTSDAQVNVVIQ